MSLSRLQLLLWTVVALSAFAMIGIGNIALRDPTPLAISVPGEIWALLGISMTSLVGSPLVLVPKKRPEPNPQERLRTLTALQAQGVPAPTSQGCVVVNPKLSDSTWGDLFKGDETGNAAQLDMGKIQMLFFTLILVLTYGVAIGTDLYRNGAIMSFPELNPAMVTLLGISHAGYLTNKAVPHSAPALAPA